ncbi:MAG: phosphoenolpyruvate--protein phosphotransferase [Pseudomonadota bacterium]
MPETYSAPRLLMNRLRQMMAAGGDDSERLGKVVKLVAGTMVADVCSIYLRTLDDMLELIATEGLRPEAVSRTRLGLDEGLVGQIAMSASPLAIQDAPRHPAFSYRPETGEDPYHAFLGVPILRSGRVTGVLTVQNRTARSYGEDEVETLQTIAMVLAEVLATVSDARRAAEADEASLRPATLQGRSLCGGIGIGTVVFHDPVVPAAKFFSADVQGETDRLQAALNALRVSVDAMVSIDTGALMGESREVLETYRLLAHDPAWAERLQEGVQGGLTAEAAVDRARREHRARLETATDSYLRERLYDLEDLDNRLLRILSGDDHTALAADSDVSHAVVVARRLGPADLLEYRGKGLAGILIEESSVSSHAAIVARAMEIPTIGNVPGITTAVEAGDAIIVDAEEGKAHLRADDALKAAYTDRIALRGERQAAYEALRDQPATSLDGITISLNLNAGLALDVDAVEEAGAEGIGLFRTEFQFLVASTLPRLGEQVELYSTVLDTAGDKPVTFRTVDLGGDKLLPNLNTVREENPALGWRSIRFALDTRGLFRRQLRALVRAASGRHLRVMFPMITIAEEFFEAKAMLLEELEWSGARGFAPPERLEIGAMLEAPALAYALPEIAEEADFLSLGTNDLMQFFFAADRMTPSVSDRYDIVSRPALRFLKSVAENCAALDLPLSLCGEASGDPLQALCLASLGFHTLSMPASQIGPVKKAIRSVHLAQLGHALCTSLSEGRGDLRKELLALLDDLGVDVTLN